MCTLHEAKFCYRLENRSLPDYFHSGIFRKHSEIHNYPTRNLDNYQFPQMKNSFMKEMLRYRIPKTFNSAPKMIIEKIYTHTISAFSKYVKKYFLDSYQNH